MKITNIFRRKDSANESRVSTDPYIMPEPDNVDSAMRRGWAFHSKNEQVKAEIDFRKALEFESRSVDAHYALALILKSQGRNEEAVIRFKQTLELINAGVIANQSRAEMLRRLSMGHINELTQGDWNLEDEVWHHKT